MRFDYVIVGGGSAGSVLARRLTEISANQVLLIEAGRDTPPGREPEDVLDSYPGRAHVNPANKWPDLKVSFTAGPHNNPAPSPPRPYEQGRIMGGGSSINGQIANRGLPGDYAEWEAHGAAGWGWDDVLPYFKKLERDLDFDGPLHGKDGPITIRRIYPDQWPGFSRVTAKTLEAEGYRYIPDFHGDFGDGWFSMPITNVYERRMTAAIGYLDAATRARPNLTIMADTHVDGLVRDGKRVTGVRARVNGGIETIAAGEVIISAGALQSPAMLLRAGIGPAEELKGLGIEVAHHSPSVGKHLMDHPAIGTAAYLAPHARGQGHQRRHMIIGLRWSSGMEGCAESDMFYVPFNRTAWHALGYRLGAFVISLRKPYSQAGEVTLASADPARAPNVAINMLADRRDVERLKLGIRFTYALAAKAPLKDAVEHLFPAHYSPRVRRANMYSLWNKLSTAMASWMMDRSALVRDGMIKTMIAPGASMDDLLNDDSAMEEWVHKGAHSTWHVSCTCRMGAAGDPGAVTDSAGKVHGIEGLRVCDASLMPVVPRANTNVPVMMMAEKIADMIKQGH